jgi:hypothetical protein
MGVRTLPDDLEAVMGFYARLSKWDELPGGDCLMRVTAQECSLK